MQIIIHPRGHFVQIRDSSVHIANIYIVYFIFFLHSCFRWFSRFRRDLRFAQDKQLNDLSCYHFITLTVCQGHFRRSIWYFHTEWIINETSIKFPVGWKSDNMFLLNKWLLFSVFDSLSVVCSTLKGLVL